MEENQIIEETTPEVETQEVTEEEALENSKNPERTKEYIEKLKEENKKYKDVLSSLTPEVPDVPQIPQADQYKNLNQADIDKVYQSMVDDKGYVDGNKLLNTLKGLDQRARDAEQRAARVEEHVKRVETAQSEQQKSQTMKVVHAKYPQLDPERVEFDPRFWEFVRNDLIGQMMGGKQDPMSAAEKGYNLFYPQKVQQVSEEDVNKNQKQQKEQSDNAKAQINATRPRASQADSYDASEEQHLIQRMRQGKKGAIAEMLRKRGQ